MLKKIARLKKPAQILLGIIVVLSLIYGYTYFDDNENFLYAQEPFYEVQGKFYGFEVNAWETSINGFEHHNRSVLHLNRKIGFGPEIAGAWNGPLPPEGTEVTVWSPTGYMSDVIIVTDDGKLYTCQDWLRCRYAQKVAFNYRVTDMGGKVICEGRTLAKRLEDFVDNTVCGKMLINDYMNPDSPFHVYTWSDNESPP